MNLFVVMIIVFAIISIANNGKTQKGRMPGKRPPWDKTWRPTVSGPRMDTRMPEMSLPKWLEATLADPEKERELDTAGGKEGEWGDEGRSGAYLEQVEPEGKEGYSTEGTQGVEGSGERIVAPEVGDGFKRAQEQQNREFALGFTEDKLMQGVVWAEILNPPRALRKYRGPRG